MWRYRCLHWHPPTCFSCVSTSLVCISPTLPPVNPLFSCVAGRCYRETGRKESSSRGGARLFFLLPASSTCSAPNPHHCLPCIPTCIQGFAWTSKACMSACLQGHLLASSLALISCPACMALGRSCHVSLATFPLGLHLPSPVLETSLDFPKHYRHLWGRHVKRTQQTLVAWLVGFPATVWLLFECLPLPPTLRRQWPDSRQRLLPLWAVVLVSHFLGLSSLWEACPAPAWLELDGGNKGFPSQQWGWVCSLEWLELATYDSGFPSWASGHLSSAVRLVSLAWVTQTRQKSGSCCVRA